MFLADGERDARRGNRGDRHQDPRAEETSPPSVPAFVPHNITILGTRLGPGISRMVAEGAQASGCENTIRNPETSKETMKFRRNESPTRPS